MSTIRSPFSSWLIACNFSSIWIVFRRFSTWIALGDVDIRFSLMLIRKPIAAGEETLWAAWLYHSHNQCMHETDSLTETSLSASHLHKTSATTGCVCHIALSLKLVHKFEEWYKFSSCFKRNRFTRNRIKRDLSVALTRTHKHNCSSAQCIFNCNTSHY
jgi:hypothetical protein